MVLETPDPGTGPVGSLGPGAGTRMRTGHRPGGHLSPLPVRAPQPQIPEPDPQKARSLFQDVADFARRAVGVAGRR